MKKKVLILATVAAMTITGALVVNTNVKEAKADINPMCPNGCIEGNSSCYCYGWHYPTREYKWNKPNIPTTSVINL